MFKLALILHTTGRLVAFSPPPAYGVHAKYESKWLATKTAERLNNSKAFHKSGTVVVVPA